MHEKIEILSLEIFKTHKGEMKIVENIKKDMNWEIGWHYHLDLAWMLREVSQLPPGSLILDAGAGRGLAQFLLAELGYNVISVDLANRFSHLRKAKKYGSIVYNFYEQKNTLNGMRDSLTNRMITYFRNKYASGGKLQNNALELIATKRYAPSMLSDGNSLHREPRECGRIFVYKSDLKSMTLLPDNFVDGVISISALEHNGHQDLEHCLNEMMRVTKPGSVLVMTVSASQSEDWFHEPSKGWCYSESSLRKLFQLPEDAISNFARKEEFMNLLKMEGNELHKRLDPMYYRSGDNGMPWGKWDPCYQPVGVIMRKRGG